TPYALLRALAGRATELENITVTHVLMIGEDPLQEAVDQGKMRHNSLFVGSADRAAVNKGKADYVPIFLNEIPSLFTDKLIPLNVAFIHVSPPDEHGFVSLGVEVLASKAAAECAAIVVAQVNDQMPRTLGDTFIHISKLNKIVEVSEPLPELERTPSTEIEKQIANYIADLIEDGSTLQLGIGGIPDAVLGLLKGKKDLGIHTEMISDGLMEALEQGIITGYKKSMHQGKAVCTFILGSKNLYDYVDNNPFFEAHPVNYTNDPFIVAQNEKMIAINSAIEIDFTGQVCSDSIGTTIYSGFGGQVDFIRGAARSKGGKPIIAIPSSAKNGQISRIVPTLKQGAGVVTTRADIHYVVTEYGVAYIHGKNLRQRAAELIKIAHPNFQEQLSQVAKERKLL
ncbi:MAG: 4-hydroxybutyrate CoA-transferase, partial [Candidatus Fischerbacteria bacterium RBG_13_37_8]